MKSTNRIRSKQPLIEWLDYAVIGVVVVTIGFAAASYGGVTPLSEIVLLGTAVTLTLATALRFLVKGITPGLAAPLVLLAAFAFLVTIQSISLPARLLGVASPTRLSRTAELLQEAPETLSISYYPLATLHGLRLHLIGVSVFAAVAMSCGGRTRAKALLLGIFVVGVAESSLALVQIFSSASGIYWSELSLGGVRSGSFVSHSNFSQFLNLTGGAGLGLLLVRLSEERHKRSASKRSGGFDTLMKKQGWLIAGL
ncbi:MAG: hypothetical protein AAF266_16620, partial [Planctomycetota bacterium]